ncbi:hypothetical protein C1701_09945 [Actinoalloteichus sp. AHMU CJ021]|uniref:uridine kinase family protein n=1 Tax=Actinoalloteichus TaxID=65496 RepID=UPI0004268CF9|nr:hypothetical protein [Actinoalloteichus caeruleus]AUS78638.1 hypothetical protein C1701_09945 [Actinoalloteichus sp. AHMU CJ021]
MLDRVLSRPPRLGRTRLVSVDGPSGSGKTTLAEDLVRLGRERGVRIDVVPTDHFATWSEPVGWWPRLERAVLAPLERGEVARYQRVEWRGGEPVPGAWLEVPPPDVLVLEGVSSARVEVADRASLLVWVEHPDPAVRLERAVARDGAGTRPHLVEWQRVETEWFRRDSTRERAHVQMTNP